ncbi:eIF2A-domain-containing protein [Piromyces finnis]|uniref:eIF2A-domain-containing protein n=1 Tax=Piromyces finnis TaxID=1754191 RepID=A0A1Y1V7V0_9FUNG|nr:eIF2A-domain-containing protein [Piromyces finnis]|eukprot:ORX48093.1 eIF2A-domain-containing protein [Piromyces finnis]
MSTIIPQIAYRSSEGLSTALGPPVNQFYNLFKTVPNVKLYQYTSDGRFLGYVNQDGVTILDAISYEPIREFKKTNVIDINFSPKGKFLALYTKFVKSQDPDIQPHNMFIYEVSTGELKITFVQKSQNNWKVQWTDDESVCARLVTGEVHFYDTRKFDLGIRSKLKLPQMTAFSMSPGRTPSVAAFVPEKNGVPASIRIFSLGNFEVPILIKTFFKADSVEMLWNKLGVSLLVWTHTEVDASGLSYYGEASLYYFSIAGKFECRVPIEPGAPIHDVSWSPNSKEFIVIHGLMPSSATLYDWRAIPIYDFPKNHRNFVRYSPHARIICIAGFGNLAGEMDFFDRLTCQKVGHAQASNSSFCDWCPDGRHVITATLTPRLRVDNGFKIWHYSGVKLFECDIKELYQISWRPIHQDAFPPHNNLSPPPKGLIEDTSKATEKKPVGVYRPPGARASASNLSLRENAMSSLSMTSNDNNVKDDNLLHPPSGLNNNINSNANNPKRANIKKQLSKRQMNQGNIPAMSQVNNTNGTNGNNAININTKNQNKGQNKNQNQKQAQNIQQNNQGQQKNQNQSNSGSTSPQQTINNVNKKPRNKNKNKGQQQQQQQQQQNGQAQVSSLNQNQGQQQQQRKQKKSKSSIDLQNKNNSKPSSPTGSSNQASSPTGPNKNPNHENQKKIKTLQRKLREIGEIKAKHAAGQKLEHTQIIKMEKENELAKELEICLAKQVQNNNQN